MIPNSDQEMIRDAFRDFAKSRAVAARRAMGQGLHLPKAAHQGLAALGTYGIYVPDALGDAGQNCPKLATIPGIGAPPISEKW